MNIYEVVISFNGHNYIACCEAMDESKVNADAAYLSKKYEVTFSIIWIVKTNEKYGAGFGALIASLSKRP